MATVPSVGGVGTRLNLLIKQGSTFGPHTVTAKNPDGSAVNLTGATVRGQIRKKALDAQAVATFDVTVTNAVGGVFTFGLTDETIGGIVTGELLEKPESSFVWDMEMELGGSVTPLFYGDLAVFREVTRV